MWWFEKCRNNVKKLSEKCLAVTVYMYMRISVNNVYERIWSDRITFKHGTTIEKLDAYEFMIGPYN